LASIAASLLLSACATDSPTAADVAPEPALDGARLAAVLAEQPAERQARYPYRHPQATLEFFAIPPGSTVVEVLPGAGWYSPILAGYLGSEGQLVGVDYPMSIWSNFPFATEEFLAQRKQWVDTWPPTAADWPGDDKATVSASRFDTLGEDMTGTVDAVLFIRALHNLYRFESNGGYLSNALAETHRILKPGGLVGVVQHKAPDDAADAWADGSRGYLKQANVIATFEAAGFELLRQSDINANPADVPGEDDIVWRLPPSYSGSRDDPARKAEVDAIGESNRMTLLFRKPPAA
ncbi:MAG: methyltransferase, partial [Halieaceae bacterium]|nr:methyltransferase [Halieaceae bacterium]